MEESDSTAWWLPIELWDNIISYCELETLEVLRLVNRFFAELLSVNQKIWQKRCEAEYGYVRSDYWQKTCGGKLHLPILTILNIPQHIIEREGVDEYEFEKERIWIRRKKCKNYFYLYSWFKKQGGRREIQIYDNDCIYPLEKGEHWCEPMKGNKEYFKEMEPWEFSSTTDHICCWPSIHTHYARNSKCYSETQNSLKVMSNNYNYNNNYNNIQHAQQTNMPYVSNDGDSDDEFERPIVKLQLCSKESASITLDRIIDRHPIPFTNRYISYATRGGGCILLSDSVGFHTIRNRDDDGWIELDDYIYKYWDMLEEKRDVINKEMISAEDEQFYRDIYLRFAEIMLLVSELFQNILVCCQTTKTKYPALAFAFSTTIFNQEKKQIYIENMGLEHSCSCITRCTHNTSPYYLVFSADPFNHQGRLFDFTLTPLRCSAILGRILRVMLQGDLSPLDPLRVLFWSHCSKQPADDEKFHLFPESETLSMLDVLSRRLLGEPSLRPSISEVVQFFVTFLEENSK